ncbi:uncharacterized protein LOC119070659 [Bradysia coprophila]|uniref:uncharacterized protein LOC119070659 n=1 Tax=Bradysia coprophila TaxID=38358 RepID=UPI00187DC86E|nr:uncharacterized protein LOC119070659 [Bradysia coprophila]
MKFFLIFALVFVISAITETYCERDVVLKFTGLDLQESFPNYFDISKVELKLKDGYESIFLVNGEVEQKVDLDDNWTGDAKIFRSETVDGEYTSYLSFRKTGICTFMKTAYDSYLYHIVKNCSNLPDPRTCPITKGKYHGNCELDAFVAQTLSRKGFYKIYADLYNGSHHETGFVFRVSVVNRKFLSD